MFRELIIGEMFFVLLNLSKNMKCKNYTMLLALLFLKKVKTRTLQVARKTQSLYLLFLYYQENKFAGLV